MALEILIPSTDKESEEFRIWAESLKIEDVDLGQPVIYFLLQGRNIVYVGQTFNIQNRIRQHLQEKKKVFDRMYYEEVFEKKELDEFEQYFIDMFNPIYNKDFTGKGKGKKKVVNNG